jgi:LysM domain
MQAFNKNVNLKLIYSLLAIIFVSICFNACNNQPKPPREPAVYAPQYFKHTVKYQGETLAMIAKWYTGNVYNWQAILDVNPGLDVRRIRIGSIINIPINLTVKQTEMPKPTASMKRESTSALGAETPTPQPTVLVPDIQAPTTIESDITTQAITPPTSNSVPTTNEQPQTNNLPPSEEPLAEQPLVVDGDNSKIEEPQTEKQGGSKAITSISDVFKKMSGAAGTTTNNNTQENNTDTTSNNESPAPSATHAAPKEENTLKTRDELLKELTEDY